MVFYRLTRRVNFLMGLPLVEGSEGFIRASDTKKCNFLFDKNHKIKAKDFILFFFPLKISFQLHASCLKMKFVILHIVPSL